MHPDLVREFIAEYQAQLNRLAGGADENRVTKKADLTQVEVEIRSLIEATKAGMFQPSMKAELDVLEANAQLIEDLANVARPRPAPSPEPGGGLPAEGRRPPCLAHARGHARRGRGSTPVVD